jgi:hypothetical protein
LTLRHDFTRADERLTPCGHGLRRNAHLRTSRTAAPSGCSAPRASLGRHAAALAISQLAPPMVALFKIDDEPLADMRAADYALLNAVQKSLVEANEYDALAEQLLRYFTLSASLLGEEQRKREARKQAR